MKSLCSISTEESVISSIEMKKKLDSLFTFCNRFFARSSHCYCEHLLLQEGGPKNRISVNNEMVDVVNLSYCEANCIFRNVCY